MKEEGKLQPFPQHIVTHHHHNIIIIISMSCNQTTTQIHDAIKCSKYNEAVILTIDEGTSDEEQQSEKREIVLIPSLDAENGGIVWNDANSSSGLGVAKDHDVGIARHLRTKRWVMPMLNDKLRNKLYDVSIRKGSEDIVKNIVSKLNNDQDEENVAGNQEQQSIRVLDIGSGTGLLAMIAAKHLKDIVKAPEIISKNSFQISVKSVEMASAMARLANKTIVENSLGDVIDVIEGHSCDDSFQPFEPSTNMKAHLCTSELLESGLLGEGLIPAMRDAWDRHLEKDALVIPQKARVYAQVIESTFVTEFRSTSINVKSVQLSPKSDASEPLLSGNIVVPIHAEGIFKSKNRDDEPYDLGMGPSDDEPIEEGKYLTEPTLVLEFDFTSKESIPSIIGRSVRKELTAVYPGNAHAILFWWEIDLLDETYSTKIGGNWQDHWQQCVFVFRAEDCHVLTKDEPFTLTTKHNDYSISFQIDKDVKIQEESINDANEPKRQKISHDEILTQHISSDRALQLNDKERMKNIFSAINCALKIKGHTSHVLDVSDFSLCSLVATVEYKAKNVTSIESSSAENLPMLSALVSQLGNKLPTDQNTFQIVQAHLDSLNLNNLQQSEAFDIVLAEPYYEIMQDWCIASALNYYYTIKALKRRSLIKSDAISVPSYAEIKCCAVEFHPDVSHAHCGLNAEEGAFICGLSHRNVTSYSKNFSKYDMTFPLWQYKWKRLSDNFTVANLEYEDSMNISGEDTWCEIAFSRPGTCHCLAFFVDYGLRIRRENMSEIETTDNDDDFQHMTTTGNRYHQQTIRMLASPKVIMEKDIGSSKLFVRPLFKNTERIHEEDYSFEIKL